MARAMIAGIFPLLLLISILVFGQVLLSGLTVEEAFELLFPMPPRAQFMFSIVLIAGFLAALTSSIRYDRRERLDKAVEPGVFE